MNLLGHCRQEVFGGMQMACEKCDRVVTIPRSCGNRHCPLCQGTKHLKWCESVCQKLPDVPHFHVVFTLPSTLGDFYLSNFKAASKLHFQALKETLEQFMANNWKLKGGFLAVLHTWGQTLNWHPHVHVLVPGGGFDPESGRWVEVRASYLFAVKALSKVYRAIFLRLLEELEQSTEIRWPEALQSKEQRLSWRTAMSQESWNVYSRATLGNTRAVVRYLARYTNRVAISNRRIRSFDASTGEVVIDYKDYRDPSRPRQMSLQFQELVRRFARHIAPQGLRRIRYSGFLNAASRYSEALAALPKVGERAVDSFGHPCEKCGASNWTLIAIKIRLPKNDRPPRTEEATPPVFSSSCGAESNRFSLRGHESP